MYHWGVTMPCWKTEGTRTNRAVTHSSSHCLFELICLSCFTVLEAGFTFMNLSVKWSGSLLLLPLPSGKTLSFLSERECFFPSTVRVLRLGEELNESVCLTNPSLRASSSSDFANILRWQTGRPKEDAPGSYFYLIRSWRIGYRIYNLTFYSISYCA